MDLIAKRGYPRNLLYLWKVTRVCNVLKLKLSNSSIDVSKPTVKRSYKILGVPNNSDQETVRLAFVKLVKKFHPDSGSSEADATKFQEIETAYRCLQHKFSHVRWKHNDCLGEYGLYYKDKNAAIINNVKEQDIEHTAPQHRQYLSYDGYGSGTLTQREKQYRKQRAENASININAYRVKKIQSETERTEEQALVTKDKEQAKKIKTRYGFDRLVEDLIQESMARGDFEDLSGQGKPLARQYDHHNPYVDLVTHKLNQVLIDNGFKPEWIMLEQEINEEKKQIKKQLLMFRTRLGAVPLNTEDDLIWQHFLLCVLNTDVKRLNSKIGKYNLVVPLLNKQMFQFNLEKEAEKVLREGEWGKVENMEKEVKKESKKNDSSIFDLFFSMFS